MIPTVPPPQPEEQTAIRRVAKKLQLPLVSGFSSALMLLLCLCVSAALLGAVATAMHMPVWIDFELMLLGWWLVWIFALAHFLYRGKRVSDDYTMHQPRNWLGGGAKSPTQSSAPGSGGGKGGGTSPGGGWGTWNLGGGYGGAEEGCMWVLAVIAAVIALFIVAWLLIEVVIPVLTLILYALIRGMLARIANDEHTCTGQFGKSLFWGTVWATAYTAPLALAVWAVHLIVAYKAA